jgi:hypothetical protein
MGIDMSEKRHKNKEELKEGLKKLKEMVERAEEKEKDYELQQHKEQVSTS